MVYFSIIIVVYFSITIYKLVRFVSKKNPSNPSNPYSKITFKFSSNFLKCPLLGGKKTILL